MISLCALAKFDEVWSFIEEKMKNPVPIYIKYILNYCGYNNGISISTIDEDDIKHFVNEVRNGNVCNYFKPILGDTDVLEGSTKKIEDFEFSRGHQKYLMSIVTFLRSYIEQNGPDITVKSSSKKSLRSKRVPRKRRDSFLSKRLSTNKSVVDIGQNFRLNNELSSENSKDDSIQNQKSTLITKMLSSLRFFTRALYAKVSSYKISIMDGFPCTANN